MKVRIINGPNLNKLGIREPAIYGTTTYEELCVKIQQAALALDLEVEIFQSNFEGQMIEWIQEMALYDALIINPAAYTHYSIAILDAMSMVEKPIVEVHLSNIHKREDFRHTSVTARGATGIIAGFGIEGYILALSYMVGVLKGRS